MQSEILPSGKTVSTLLFHTSDHSFTLPKAKPVATQFCTSIFEIIKSLTHIIKPISHYMNVMPSWIATSDDIHFTTCMTLLVSKISRDMTITDNSACHLFGKDTLTQRTYHVSAISVALYFLFLSVDRFLRFPRFPRFPRIGKLHSLSSTTIVCTSLFSFQCCRQKICHRN